MTVSADMLIFASKYTLFAEKLSIHVTEHAALVLQGFKIPLTGSHL